jgi:hypothetical protein
MSTQNDPTGGGNYTHQQNQQAWAASQAQFNTSYTSPSTPTYNYSSGDSYNPPSYSQSSYSRDSSSSSSYSGPSQPLTAEDIRAIKKFFALAILIVGGGVGSYLGVSKISEWSAKRQQSLSALKFPGEKNSTSSHSFENNADSVRNAAVHSLTSVTKEGPIAETARKIDNELNGIAGRATWVAGKLSSSDFNFSDVKSLSDWKSCLANNLNLYHQMYFTPGYFLAEIKQAIYLNGAWQSMIIDPRNVDLITISPESPGTSSAETRTKNREWLKLCSSSELAAQATQNADQLLQRNFARARDFIVSVGIRDSRGDNVDLERILRSLNSCINFANRGIIVREKTVLNLIDLLRKL